MPLDEDIRRFLAEVQALDPPPAWEQPLETVRQGIRQMQAAQAKRMPVAEVADLAIPGPGGDLGLRLYRPDAGPVPPPLIVFFHGGGFVLGDLDTHDDVCRRLCREVGALVVAVDYRLAPEAPFPAAAEDAIAATRWCMAQAAALGADPARVATCGDSAGGNLAAVAAIGVRDLGLSPALAGQVLIYPVTDLRDGDYPSRVEMAEGFGLSQQAMDWFNGLYAPEPWQRQHPHASPVLSDDLSGLPPTFVMTAAYDPLCSEGEAYVRRLQQAGVAVQHLHLPGANHGVFTSVGGFRAGEVVWGAVLDWLRATLRVAPA